MNRDQTVAGGVASQPLAGFSRPAFYQGQVLAPADLNAVVAYSQEKLLLLLRYLVGPGLAGGLTVRPARPAGPRVVVEPGYAVDGDGHDIYLQAPAELDLTPAIQAAARSDTPITYEVRIRATEGPQARTPVGGPWLPDSGSLVAVRTLEGALLEAVPVGSARSSSSGFEPAMQLLMLQDRPISVAAAGPLMQVICDGAVQVVDAATLSLLDRNTTTPPAETQVIKPVLEGLSFDTTRHQLIDGEEPFEHLPSIADAVASPSGDRVYVSLMRNNAVGVLTPDLQLLGLVPAGRRPDQLLLHPTAPYLFVINQDSADVTVFHQKTGRVIGTLRAPANPGGAAFDSEGRLWIPSRAEATVVVIDPALLLGGTVLTPQLVDYLPLARIHLEPEQTEITSEQIDNNVRNAYRLTTLAQLGQWKDQNAIGG
ncbi:MAG TPA: hypothetical protein VK464_16130 [Symbiobacteriaceae bacterium]|jgi:DNA-binding beta-propeller fold protein YncE|nr:hypothetical protein [Symbiobacteriaceae bacterium]